MTLTEAKSLKRHNNPPLGSKPGKKKAAKIAAPAKKKPAPSPLPEGVREEVVDIDTLTIDPELQQRKEGGSESTIKEYGSDLLDGVELPPIEAVETPEGLLLVWDGFQRVAAHQLPNVGLKEIKCRIRKGTREDAVWLSCSANKSHGLRRTNADKRKAITSALMLERTRAMSDRQIAQHCGGSGPLVGTIRAELEEAGAIPKVTERTTASGVKITVDDAAKAKKSAAGQKSGADRKVEQPEEDDAGIVDDAAEADALGIAAEIGKDIPGEKPTKAAKATADVEDGILMDADDNVVPEKLHVIFSKVDAFHKLKRVLDAVADQYRTLAASEAGAFVDIENADIIEGLATELMNATPYRLAPNRKLGWEPTFPEKIEYNAEALAEVAEAPAKKPTLLDKKKAASK